MDRMFDWQGFWSEWRNKPAESEYDLYFQVAKTVNSRAMERSLFDSINDIIVETLALRSSDTLIELCCGNGLCTYELAKRVERVIAIDFSPHLIADARKFKAANNIEYIQNDVVEFLQDFQSRGQLSKIKCLMNDSLAYFTPSQLKNIIVALDQCSNGDFSFLIRGIPNDELKWNYYDTEERKSRYEQFVETGDITNDGLGRWWKPKEIFEICNELNLKCEIRNQPEHITNYRMDVLIDSEQKKVINNANN